MARQDNFSELSEFPFLLEPYATNTSERINEAFLYLSYMCSSGIKEIVTTIPKEPKHGDKYIVGSEAAIGPWDGRQDYIALYYGREWRWIKPREGNLFWLMSKGKLLVFQNGKWMVVGDKKQTPGSEEL